jgi:hypothetical protein
MNPSKKIPLILLTPTMVWTLLVAGTCTQWPSIIYRWALTPPTWLKQNQYKIAGQCHAFGRGLDWKRKCCHLVIFGPTISANTGCRPGDQFDGTYVDFPKNSAGWWYGTCRPGMYRVRESKGTCNSSEDYPLRTTDVYFCHQN